MPADAEEYVPCYNFAMVCPGVYRSAHPTRKNFTFLRALHLKSVCYLCPEAYPEDNVAFCKDNSISIFHFNLEENREPFSEVRRDIVDAVMRVVMDTRNHPILIHCERGRHRTGVICGCVRKLQGWSLGSIYSDYTLHNSGKGRLSDQQFLDLYEPIVKVELPYAPSWLLEEFMAAGQLLRHASGNGAHLGTTSGNELLLPMLYCPQVVLSNTTTMLGTRGTDAFERTVVAEEGTSHSPHKEPLTCVSSTRSGITLILCKDRSLELLQRPTEPMVLAVRPQCSYILAEHVAKKGGDTAEKKEKKDKKDKKEKDGKDKKVGDGAKEPGSISDKAIET